MITLLHNMALTNRKNLGRVLQKKALNEDVEDQIDGNNEWRAETHPEEEIQNPQKKKYRRK